VHTCDRCSEIIATDRTLYQRAAGKAGAPETVDFCPRCMDSFKLWLSHKPDQASEPAREARPSARQPSRIAWKRDPQARLVTADPSLPPARCGTTGLDDL
jgi:hypothetical protein